MPLFGGVEIHGKPDLDNVARLDRLPIPMIRRCRRLGMAIDIPYFQQLSSEFAAERDEIEKEIASYIPREALHEFSQRSMEAEDELGDVTFNARSAEQIGKLLFDVLHVGHDKKLKTTKGGTRLSTGKRQLEWLRMDHPIVPRVLRYRELDKLKTTYSDKLPKLAVFHPRSNECPKCGLAHDVESYRVHGEMGTTRAETGRINHKNPNLGNVPTRTDDGQRVQAGFIAPQPNGGDIKGRAKRLVAADASQIELRDLAHLANAQSMIQVYCSGGDIHDNTARKVFNLPPEVKPDKIKHRMASKRTNFGIQNGTTEKGLYLQLVMDYGQSGIPVPDWLTEDWCKWFIAQWLESYPEVQAYFDLQHYRARRYGFVWDLFGRIRQIPEVRSTHSWVRDAGLRQAQNMPVTATAAGQLKLAMGYVEQSLAIMYEDLGLWCWPLVTVHDMIMAEADEDTSEAVLEAMEQGFNTCMRDLESGEHRFRVPMESDGEIMERWKK